LSEADLDFGEDFALTAACDGAPVLFEGYHFSEGRKPFFVFFRHRGRGWRFQVFDVTPVGMPPHDGAVLFEERGVTEGDVYFAEGAEMFRECLKRWRDEEVKWRKESCE